MDFKIKVATLFRWWLIIYALLETGVISGLGINNIYITILTYFSPIGMFVIYLLFRSGQIPRRIAFISKYLAAFFLFLIIEYVYTCEMYDLNLLGSIWPVFANYYFWTKLLLIFPIMYVFEYDGGVERLLFSFVNTAVVGNIMHAIAWVGKSIAGIRIFPTLSDSITGTRFGRLRYGACKMHTMAFDIAFSKAFEREKRTWVLIAVFMGIYQFYIANGRSQAICYVLSMIVCLYFSTQWSSQNERKYKFFFVLVMVLGVVLLIYNGFFDSVYNTFFSTSSSEYGSTENRIFAINYYTSVIKDRWVFGMGLLYDDSRGGGTLYRILRNPAGWNSAYYEDLGLLGQFYNYGLVGTIFFVIAIIRMFRIAKKALEQKSIYGPMLITLFTHFITMTFSSMSMFILNNSLQLAIELALFEYINYGELDCVEDDREWSTQ